MAYTKLFHSIVTSTIWRETDPTRIVWITMLALAEPQTAYASAHSTPVFTRPNW